MVHGMSMYPLVQPPYGGQLWLTTTSNQNIEMFQPQALHSLSVITSCRSPTRVRQSLPVFDRSRENRTVPGPR